MTSVLLLGAGFSRNWGGWLADEVFEYLLGCPEIARDDALRSLLWKHQPVGGFEAALEEAQLEFARNSSNRQRLDILQGTVTRMFDDMNSAFFAITNFEFQNQLDRTLKVFLTKFDAIFTLNQDLLVEHHYKDNYDISLAPRARWNGIQIPGMSRVPPQEGLYANSWARATWVTGAEYKIEARSQPYVKLHGSANWRTADGGPLIVMGGQKAQEIGLHEVLAKNARQFDEYLCRGDTRLMVIGYGFRDVHINAAIDRASQERGLKMFLISPQGSGLATSLNETDTPGLSRRHGDLVKLFERSLIGASRRSLRDIFGADTVEFNKVQRFFDA